MAENYSMKSEHSCSTGTSKNTNPQTSLSQVQTNDHENTSQSLGEIQVIECDKLDENILIEDNTYQDIFAINKSNSVIGH